MIFALFYIKDSSVNTRAISMSFDVPVSLIQLSRLCYVNMQLSRSAVMAP